MAEIKLSCPHCGQHLKCDESWLGQVIPCPACQGTFPAPSTSTGSSPAPLAKLVTEPAPSSVSEPPTRTPRRSKLAVASLVLSLLGIGAIAGIICGHLAKAKMKRDPKLSGGWLATAGLIIGYLFVAGGVLMAVLLLVFAANWSESPPSPLMSPLPNQTVQASPGPSTSSVVPTWTLDPGAMEFPDWPVQGQIHGRAFRPETVALRNDALVLRQGEGMFAELELTIFLFEQPQAIPGASLAIPPNTVVDVPHVWKKWRDQPESPPNQEAFTSGYALRLEFGPRQGDEQPGRFYLCLPDPQQTSVAGQFTATVE